MVVDGVTCHWVTMVTKEEAGPEGFGRALQWISLFFYAENGIPPPSTRPPQVELDNCRGYYIKWACV